MFSVMFLSAIINLCRLAVPHFETQRRPLTVIMTGWEQTL